MRVPLTLTVNGVAYPLEVEPSTTLLRAVREHVGLTGAKEGCDDSECGACMMLLDSRPVNACSYLALQAEGRAVTTVEGLAADGGLSPLQRVFLDYGGVQCGFCTPGMLISATALLAKHPNPTEEEVSGSAPEPCPQGTHSSPRPTCAGAAHRRPAVSRRTSGSRHARAQRERTSGRSGGGGNRTRVRSRTG